METWWRAARHLLAHSLGSSAGDGYGNWGVLGAEGEGRRMRGNVVEGLWKDRRLLEGHRVNVSVGDLGGGGRFLNGGLTVMS